MKIDLEYIRNFLQTTIEDSQLIYLINRRIKQQLTQNNKLILVIFTMICS